MTNIRIEETEMVIWLEIVVTNWDSYHNMMPVTGTGLARSSRGRLEVDSGKDSRTWIDGPFYGGQHQPIRATRHIVGHIPRSYGVQFV
jgi:hypothetical protein